MEVLQKQKPAVQNEAGFEKLGHRAGIFAEAQLAQVHYVIPCN